jgi:hypothetical protein
MPLAVFKFSQGKVYQARKKKTRLREREEREGEEGAMYREVFNTQKKKNRERSRKFFFGPHSARVQ